jgi:hypothetical protein
MLVRSYWLGVIEATRPELCPAFFEVDLAPCILRFLCRDDGVYCSELMKGTDCILHSASLVYISSTFVTRCGRHVRGGFQAAGCQLRYSRY